MKKLLIHNDQFTSDFQNHFELQRKFNITQPDTLNSDFSFDSFCNDKLGLNSGLASFLKSQNSIDIIFIPYHLSTNNYLEYAGLKIAMHIRLSDWGYHDIPIVFIGNESIEQVLRINKFGNLLLTAGIYKLSTNELNEESILRICNTVQKNFQPENNNRLTKSNMNDFLERVEIKPPGHYDSKHSVDNELSLLRWSQYIGLELPKVRDNFDSSLYFKYINKQKPIPLNSDNSKVYDFGEGKVLLIDDQWKNGWNEFYNALFKSSVEHSIDFRCEEIQKGAGKEEIIHNVLKQVSSFNPNVVILDLRLHDDDFKRNSPISKSTGVQILKKINQKHPGISVIITTASSKAETYEITKDFAYAYIQKTVDQEISKSINKIYSRIRLGIKISRLLMQFHEYSEMILDNLKTGGFDKEYQEDISNQITIASEVYAQSMQKSIENDELELKERESIDRYKGLTYIQLFLIIEKLCNNKRIFEFIGKNAYIYADQQYKIVQKNKSFVQFDPAKGRFSLKNESTKVKDLHNMNFKMSALLLFRFGLVNSSVKLEKRINWTKVYRLRNEKAVHDENKDKNIRKTPLKNLKGELIKVITDEQIYDILVFINFLHDKENIIKKEIKNHIFSDEITSEALSKLKSMNTSKNH